MKKSIFIILVIIAALQPIVSVSAQTATPKPTEGEKINEKLNSQINQLKDKIASRVSELNLVEKKGYIGEVTESTTNKITIKDLKGNTKLIDVDEITKFSSGTSKTFGLSDLTKGTKITALGLYNKQTKRLLARFIATSVDPVFITGGVTSIDTRNRTLDVLSADQKTTKIDIGTATRISSFGSDGTPSRLTLTGIAVGDRITTIGYPDKTNPALIIADRISVLSAAPKDPKLNITQPSPTAAAIPTAPPARRTTVPPTRR